MLKKINNKRGLSTIVTSVILIALVIIAAALIWTFVNKMVKDQLKSAGSCVGIFDQIKLDRAYTCYDYAGPNNDQSNRELHIAVEFGDIEVEELTITVGKDALSKSFDLVEGEKYNYVRMGTTGYPNDPVNDINYPIQFPGENERVLYVANMMDSYFSIFNYNYPTSIKIFPTINGEKCGEVDAIAELQPCPTPQDLNLGIDDVFISKSYTEPNNFIYGNGTAACSTVSLSCQSVYFNCYLNTTLDIPFWTNSSKTCSTLFNSTTTPTGFNGNACVYRAICQN